MNTGYAVHDEAWRAAAHDGSSAAHDGSFPISDWECQCPRISDSGTARCELRNRRAVEAIATPAAAFVLFRIMLTLVALFISTPTYAQAGRIYTKPIADATGGIIGKAPEELTHAMAVERDRTRVFLAALSDGGKTFRFEHLPVGKYDLVIVTKGGGVFEGLALGGSLSTLTAASAAHLEKRIKVADTFFNQYVVHRSGLGSLDESGDGMVLALVERQRADDVLKQSGERLNQMVRRLEIIELHQATDDWQMVGTRHLYREGEPIAAKTAFFRHAYIPELGNIRVVHEEKDLGTVPLPATAPETTPAPTALPAKT